MFFIPPNTDIVLCPRCTKPVTTPEYLTFIAESPEIYFCTHCKERVFAWKLLIKKKENHPDIVIPAQRSFNKRPVQRARKKNWHDEELLLVATQTDFEILKEYFNTNKDGVYTNKTTAIELYHRWRYKTYN